MQKSEKIRRFSRKKMRKICNFFFFLTQRASARARPSSSVLDKKDKKTRENVTCLPRTRAERTGLTVSIQHACLKILSVDQITLLCVFHQKWTLHRMLDPACRGFALPVKKGAHSCGDRCVKTGCQSVARPDGYRSKTVSCRVMFVRRWQISRK